MAKCKIHQTNILNTHGNMYDTSDKSVKYTWKNVRCISQKCYMPMAKM